MAALFFLSSFCLAEIPPIQKSCSVKLYNNLFCIVVSIKIVFQIIFSDSTFQILKTASEINFASVHDVIVSLILIVPRVSVAEESMVSAILADFQMVNKQ